MRIVGIGVDIVEIDRIHEACRRRPAFIDRVYTALEAAYSMSKGSPWQHLAARFAAKEAVAKALGASFAWHDVEIVSGPQGKPLARLHGQAEIAARRLGVSEMKLSLSHSRRYAVAQAMAVGGDVGESGHGRRNEEA